MCPHNVLGRKSARMEELADDPWWHALHAAMSPINQPDVTNFSILATR
jgi:hypothetical protein